MNMVTYFFIVNFGVVTVSLPDIALSARRAIYGDNDKNEPFKFTPELEAKFWEIFDERLNLCHKALRKRYERVASITSDVAPILWQAGAFARLKPGESVEPLLRNNYSTLSLGYAGLYECVLAMTGESHSGGFGMEFGLKVMQALNDKTKEWREAENIGYSLYGSPIESTTYKFAKCLRHRFGVIKDITDRDYITNSYHINVRENINIFDKFRIESVYQKLSPGGWTSTIASNSHPKLCERISKRCFIFRNKANGELKEYRAKPILLY